MERRELSNSLRSELKKAFPTCKFSVKITSYGAEVTVLKAPASWYKNTNDLKQISGRTYDTYNHFENNEHITEKGAKALQEIEAIENRIMKGHHRTYYDEYYMEMTEYGNEILPFGEYSSPVELIADTMNGFKNITPQKSTINRLKNAYKRMI